MAFPPGVTTATISLGTMFDFRGNAVEKVTAKVEVFLGGNATKLNYRGTGQTVVPSVFTVDAVEGMISFQLPHVDQPGFFAGDGTEAKYWAYIISIQATPPGSKAVKWVKRLQPLVGQDSIDLDNVVDGELTSFVSTPQATVTSVNGMTGDVWVSGDGSGGSVDLSGYATKDELDAAIQSVDTSFDTTEIYSRINEVERAIPDTSALVSRDEIQGYALAEDIPDTSSLATKDELQNYALAEHTHTDLEQRIMSLEDAPSGGGDSSVPAIGTPLELESATGEPVYPVDDSRLDIQDALNDAVNGGERAYWSFLEQRGGHVKMAPGTYYLSAPEDGNPSLVIPRGVTFDFSEAHLVFAYPETPTTKWSAILFKSQSGLVLGRMSTFGNAPDSAHVYDAIRVWHTDNYNRITGTPHAKISSFRGAVIRTLGAYVTWVENFRAAFCSHGIIHGGANGLVPAGTAPYDWPTVDIAGEAVGPARRPTDLWVKNAQFDGIRGDVFVVGAVGSVDNPNGIKGDSPTDPTDTVTGGNLHLDTVLVEGSPARVIRARHLSQIVTRDLHIEEVGAPNGPIFDLDTVYGVVSMRDTRFNTSMQRSAQMLDGNTTQATPNRMFSLGYCRQFIADGMYIQNSGSDMTFAVESWDGAWDAMKYQVSGLAHDPANTGHMQPGELLKDVDESNFITNALPASATSTTFVEDPAGSGTYRMVN